MTKSFYAIVNGAAGSGRCRSRADQALAKLREQGFELDVHVTGAPGHATGLAIDAYNEGHREFLVVGGDGTSFEVLNGLFESGTPADVKLAMLPLGTGNSFLRDFGIGDSEDAINAILGGETRTIDVIRVEHSNGALHYMNTLGVGFVAKAGEPTNRRFKPLGPAGYVAAVVSSVVTLDYPVHEIRLDGSPEVDARPNALLSFSNSQYTGGAMKMAPTADVSDGKLDIVRVGKLSRADLLKTFPKIFAGRHTEHPDVDERKAVRVDFQNEHDEPVLIDGELRHLCLRSLNVVPRCIEVYA
ncbi:MAG: YegS/Rv2252/BmrU family lipid kinase [Polyangiales bacterium]